ncbi:hypothetical protein D3C76_1134500 [compost metagenome]
MRAHGHGDARVMTQVAEQFDAQVQGFFGAARARDREIQQRHGDLCADAAVMYPFAGDLGEEVHVGKAGDAAFDLLGNGQVGAIANKILIDPATFGRPDVLFQPGHQRQVVGQAAEQGHRRVAVGVDQPGAEQAAWQLAGFGGDEALGLGPGADENNLPVANAQAMILQYHPGRFDRHQPGRQEQQVERRSGFGHGGISLRHLG